MFRGINHDLINIINYLGNKNITELENQVDLIFESLSEILLLNKKGDNSKNNEEIKYFCEKKVIENIIVLSGYKQKEINLKIIKYISFFITNSPADSNKKCFFNFFNYILESKYINSLIINLNYEKEENNDDYLSYYINFLKVITNKINYSNIKYLFNWKYNIFPLFDQILILLNYDDIMIRNSARNIFLSLMKLNYNPLIEYICDIPRIAIFIILCNKIKSNILLMINLKNNNKNLFLEKTKELKEKIIEDFLFIQDILSLNIYKINYIILNCIFSIIFLFLFKKIISFSNNVNNAIIISEISKCINILRIIFKNIKDENIKNILCFLIFSKSIYNNINQYLTHDNIEENKDYKIESIQLLNSLYLNFNYSYSKIKFDDYVIYNYSNNFLKSIRYIKQSGIDENIIYKEIKEISNLLQLKDENEDIQFSIKFLNDKLVTNNNNFIKRMYNFHYFISKKSAINIGICNEGEKNSFMSILYTNFLYIQNENIVTNNQFFQSNILKSEILNFFVNEYKQKNNKNSIFNIILFFLEIIKDKYISNEIKNILNICITNNNHKETNNMININDLPQNYSKIIKYPDINEISGIIYPTEIINPINKDNLSESNLQSIIINNEKIDFFKLNFANDFFSKINLSKSFINDNCEIIINIIYFIFSPIYELNNNDILLCFKLIESLYNDSILLNNDKSKLQKILAIINPLYLETLEEIKDILFKNNYDVTNKIFKFSYSLFEKCFYLYHKDISHIINNYYSDLRLSSFVIINNSKDVNTMSKLKNLFQKFISLHDMISLSIQKINNDIFLFKQIEFPLKLIKDERFVIDGKINLDEFSFTKIDVSFSKIINKNGKNYYLKEEYLTMFLYNNYLFFSLSPKNVKNFSINSIKKENLYTIKYMFYLRYINLINDSDQNSLFIIFDENEYNYNILIKFTDRILLNKAKNIFINGINNSIILEYSSVSSFINSQIVEYYKDAFK